MQSLPPLAAAIAPDDRRAGLPPPEEAAVFWLLRRRQLATALRQAFREGRLRLSLVALLSFVLWGGLYLLFADGFRFLKVTIADPGLHDQTVRAVFGVFFVALMVMLVFSSAIVLYSVLFRGRDVAWLFTLPVRAERVFLHKFQEAVVVSSWAFVLLGSPMLLAYGRVAQAPWYYYVLLLPFLLAFVFIPAALGALACLVIVRYVPQRRKQALAASAAFLALVGIAWGAWTIWGGPRADVLTPEWFTAMLGRMRLAEGRLFPSWWLSTGLLEATLDRWNECLMFLSLLVANALFGQQAALWTAARLYRTAYAGLHTSRAPQQRARTFWIDRLLARAAFLPTAMRELIVKDLRLFRRDPVQWSQFLIFFGLLALYFVNVRRFGYDVHHEGWANMVSFLNVTVVGLILSTFTTRFIFPMISLEGQRFWILGLLPLRRETILLAKFCFAAGGSLIPCALLVLLSDLMLGVPPRILLVHQITCLFLCLGLAAIAVGLGAQMPNLREQSPSKIAAGFGGTINLVVSALYITAIVVLSALPHHLDSAARLPTQLGWLHDPTAIERFLARWLFYGTTGSVLLTLAATVAPLWIGIRAFRRLEF